MAGPLDDDHPYVAHYEWPETAADADEARRGAEALARAERESKRQRDFARWRVLRYGLGIVLVCFSIFGGALAVIGALAAASSGSGETIDLVVGLSPEGAVTRTLTSTQLFVFVAVLVALEVVLICAALLLFAGGLHLGAWAVVTAAACAAAAFLLWGVFTGQWWASSSEYLYIAAFPAIAVAGALELVRARWLRGKWGEAAG